MADIRQNTNNDDFIDGPPISRGEMILTAHEFTQIHWEMMEKNQTGISCNDNFISDYSIGPRIGMGYMWGGWDDVDTFIEKINSGHGTGTGGYVSYKEFSKNCVTGISCTGLVSRAWHLNRKYTLNYPQYPEIEEQFHRITYQIEDINFLTNKTELLKKGDAFINNWHIILFVYETRDGKAMIIDSRSNGVEFREMSWQKLAVDGYKAIRYNNIVEINNPLGTIADPILINSDDFPISLENNSRDFVSMEFDNYSIAPSFNEQGPEVIYKLVIQSKQEVLFYIDEVINEGIDNNIYLLKSLERSGEYFASNCIARDDFCIVRELEAGEYYIIVDSGKDQPGEFKLNIEQYQNKIVETTDDNIKILFIGSSYFNFNNLPDLFGNLSIAGGKDVLVDTRIINGTHLEYHASSQVTEDKINQKEWDYVILQGVGALMAYPDYYTNHPVYPALKTLQNKIYSNSESTKMIFCLPWAFEDGMIWKDGWTDMYDEMQNKINVNTIEYADDIGFIIAPVGIAWQKVLTDKNYPLHYLHRSDWNHPSLRGSYLMACVIYATIFTENIVDLPFHAGLPSDEAQYFQSVASSIVMDDLDLWLDIKNIDLNDHSIELEVKQNYPNPFNSSTTIQYGLDNDSHIVLGIYDINGKLISTLQDKNQTSGWHSVIWNGTNQSGEITPAGLYIGKVTSDNEVKTTKLMLLK